MLNHNNSYCYECNSEHVKHTQHKTIKYNDKSYYCFQYLEKVIEYCFTYKENICKECQSKNANHKVKNFELMTPNEKEMQDLGNKLEEINKLIQGL